MNFMPLYILFFFFIQISRKQSNLTFLYNIDSYSILLFIVELRISGKIFLDIEAEKKITHQSNNNTVVLMLEKYLSPRKYSKSYEE